MLHFKGPFSTGALKEAGFECITFKFALRNPLLIAKYAQDVAQDGARNLLSGVLRSPIDVSRSTNIPDGQVITIDKSSQPLLVALNATVENIPWLKFALIFIDDNEMKKDIVFDAIKNSFVTRDVYCIFNGTDDTLPLKKWLCEPKSRSYDICIIGRNHQCNGIETEIVVHVLPGNCPMCGISSADPVVISRAKAMFISATYQRYYCTCGWKKQITINDLGWETPCDSETEEEEHEPVVDEITAAQNDDIIAEVNPRCVTRFYCFQRISLICKLQKTCIMIYSNNG